METYVPYPDVEKVSEVLRPREIDISVVTSLAVLSVLHEVEGKDISQTKKLPVVRMWRGHEPFLINYGATLNEGRSGKYAKQAVDRFAQHLQWAMSGEYTLDPPAWWSDTWLNITHQAMLFRMHPAYYGRKFPKVRGDERPYWPEG